MTSPPQAPVKVPSRRVVMGPIVEVEESYAREVGVPPAVLFPLLIAALAVDVVGLLVSAVFRIGVPTARRPLRTLRKGPEYMVTPVWVRDADDSLVEVAGPPPGYAPLIESLDTERLRSLGWRPGVALEEGLRSTLDWMREAA